MGLFTKFCKWYVSQKVPIADSSNSELKSPTMRKLSYFVIWMSKFPRNKMTEDFAFVRVIGTTQNKFLPKIQLYKEPFKIVCRCCAQHLNKLSSTMAIYLRNGGAYHSMTNWALVKEESSFVSEIMRMSVLPFIILVNLSNLFLTELIFICPINILLTLFRWAFSKTAKASNLQ